MQISEIDYDKVTFDNGSYLVYSHCPECDEKNYASFPALELYTSFPHGWAESVFDLNFDDHLELKKDVLGFAIFDDMGNKLFIPCYSEQNGSYSRQVTIEYHSSNGDLLQSLIVEAELD